MNIDFLFWILQQVRLYLGSGFAIQHFHGYSQFKSHRTETIENQINRFALPNSHYPGAIYSHFKSQTWKLPSTNRFSNDYKHQSRTATVEFFTKFEQNYLISQNLDSFDSPDSLVCKNGDLFNDNDEKKAQIVPSSNMVPSN